MLELISSREHQITQSTQVVVQVVEDKKTEEKSICVREHVGLDLFNCLDRALNDYTSSFEQFISIEDMGFKDLLCALFFRVASSVSVLGSKKTIEEILQRRFEIKHKKDTWSLLIEKNQNLTESFYEFFTEAVSRLPYLERIYKGCGGSYLLKDKLGIPQFIVKANDEDAFCLNNIKGLASPFNDSEYKHRMRLNIPLYEGAQREVFAYEFSKLIGLEGSIPKAGFAVIESDCFNDITDISDYEKARGMRKISRYLFEKGMSFIKKIGMDLQKYLGEASREKLCSFHEYLHDSQDLAVFLDNQIFCITNDSERKEAEDRFNKELDIDSFQKANVLVWLLGDQDAHLNNFRLVTKNLDDGSVVHFIKKIDNGLTLPQKHTYIRNYLAYFSGRKNPLSEELTNTVMDISKESLRPLIESCYLEESWSCLKERIDLLQELVSRNLSVEEIHMRMNLLRYRKEGEMLAYSTESLEVIKEKLKALQEGKKV
jgi:hypothetical protein